MSNIMNETVHAAKNGMESAKESTMHALGTAKHEVESAKESTMATVASVGSMILKGVAAAAGILATLQKLDRDDGLAWIGLARRRSPLVTVAVFAAGAAVGVGVGLLFAPETGADLRSMLLGRPRAGKGAAKTAAAPESAAVAPKSAVEEAPHNGKPARA